MRKLNLIINSNNKNNKVYIPRIEIIVNEPKWPLTLKRRQFPVKTCYAMTINKSQGQSLRHVGIYLSKPVFTHGQLYVVLSRVRSVDGLKINVPRRDGAGKCSTKNVVYNEVFRELR